MSLWRVIVLAIIQGLTELLPVSSSAHVVVAEKLMGMNPSSPELSLLLVMLHTGTMCAVVMYFWDQWRKAFFQSITVFKKFAVMLILATTATGVVGVILLKLVEKFWYRGQHTEIEELFGHLELISLALAVVGVLIIIAGWIERQHPSTSSSTQDKIGIEPRHAWLIGAVQGLCLPFRGFSRSGATISTGILAGVSRRRAEEFSFALAILVTPPVIAREILRFGKASHLRDYADIVPQLMPCLLGGLCAFAAGLLALKWLSSWLESGRWYLFGIYCLIAALVVGILYGIGY